MPPDSASDDFWALPTNRSYYEIFNVSEQASPDEIKRAYRRLALRYHPDRHAREHAARAEELFKRIQAMYAVLSDPVRRSSYNAQSHQARRSPPVVPDHLRVQPLAEILRAISRYQHIFDGTPELLPSPLKEYVSARLRTDLGERMVDIARHQFSRGLFESVEEDGTREGRLVLTNMRLFIGEWSEKGRSSARHIWWPDVSRLRLRADDINRTDLQLKLVPRQGVAGTTGDEVQVFGVPRATDRLLLLASIWQVPIEVEPRHTGFGERFSGYPTFWLLLTAGLLICAWISEFTPLVGAAAGTLALCLYSVIASEIGAHLRVTLTSLLAETGLRRVTSEDVAHVDVSSTTALDDM